MTKLSKETFDLYFNYQNKWVYCPYCDFEIMLDHVGIKNTTPIVLICEECKNPLTDIEE